MRSKQLLIFLFLYTFLLVSNTFANTQNIIESSTKKNETLFTTGVHQRTKCMYECPPFKKEYFGRISNINMQQGTTECYVYEKDDPSIMLGVVTSSNNYCKAIFDKTNVTPLKKELNKTIALKSYKDLEKLEEKFYKQYSNLGSTQFVNVPMYMIAGLTIDDEILNIENTIKYNEITLNNDYSLYPNSSAFNEEEFREKLYKDNLTITNKINQVAESMGIKDAPLPNDLQRIESSNLIESVKSILTNSVIFIMIFLNEYNESMLIAKTFIMFTVLPVTVGFAIFSKLSKSLQDISDFDDVLERVVLGIATLFIFYFSTTTIKTGDDKNDFISQTTFHQMFRPVLYKGAEIADEVGQGVTKAYLKYKLRTVGLAPIDVINETRNEIVKVEKEQAFLKNTLLPKCYSTYNTSLIKQDLGVRIGLNVNFPPTEKIVRESEVLKKDIQIDFYKAGAGGYLINANDEVKNNLFSISSCYKFERKYQKNKLDLEKYNYVVNSYNETSKDDVLKNQIYMIANIQMRNDAELGFISLPLLATTSVMIDNIGTFENPLGERINQEKVLKDFRSSGGYEVGATVSGEGIMGKVMSPINWYFQHLPYLIIPPADTIRNTVSDLLQGISEVDILGMLPFKSILDTLIDQTNNKSISNVAKDTKEVTEVSDSSKLKKLVIYILSSIITVYIMMYILAYLPIIALATASFATIFFYYLSVELYYLVIPFLVAFAFATNQSDLMKNFLKNGLIIAFKPLLIVLSIVLALFAKDFFESLNTVLVNWQFEPMFALTNTINLDSISNVGTYAFSDWGLIFFKGFLLVGNSVIAVFTVFYIVLNGANMILDLFGIREGSFDAQNTIGTSVDNKSQNWQTPI